MLGVLKIRVSVVRLTRTFGARPSGAFGVVVCFANRSAPGHHKDWGLSLPDCPHSCKPYAGLRSLLNENTCVGVSMDSNLKRGS